MNKHIESYIREQVEIMYDQGLKDFDQATSAIIEKILDPNFQPRKPKAPKKMITKVNSYNDFMKTYASQSYQLIYQALRSSPDPISRADIAEHSGLRMSTICGRIAELLEAGVVSIAGTKKDSDTNKEVETIILNGAML